MQDRDVDKDSNEKYTHFAYYKIENEKDRDYDRIIHGDGDKEQKKGDDQK